MIGAINLIIIIFAVFALSRAYLRFKEKKISLIEFILWIVIWVGAIIVAIVPEASSYISQLFGIGRGVDLLVYLSIILIFYLIFRLYIKIDQAEQSITKIVRKLSKED